MRYALAALLMLPLAAGPDEAEHDPTVKLGTISGTLTPAGRIERLWAIDRNLDLLYQAEIDRKTGKFTIANLLPGRYDLILTTKNGARIEGADLIYRESELAELARQEERRQGIVREKPGPMTDEDRKWLTEHVFKVKRFEDFRKLDAISGDSQRATLLVELLRRRKFHGMKGREVIWRVELWYFKKQYGGWEHAPNTDVVLTRKRMKAADFAQLSHIFTDKLGGIAVDKEGKSKPVTFNIPANAKTDQGFKEGRS